MLFAQCVWSEEASKSRRKNSVNSNSIHLKSERFTSCETLPHPPRIASLPCFAPCFSNGGNVDLCWPFRVQLPKFRTCAPISIARSMIHDNSIVLTPLTPRHDSGKPCRYFCGNHRIPQNYRFHQ